MGHMRGSAQLAGHDPEFRPRLYEMRTFALLGRERLQYIEFTGAGKPPLPRTIFRIRRGFGHENLSRQIHADSRTGFLRPKV